MYCARPRRSSPIVHPHQASRSPLHHHWPMSFTFSTIPLDCLALVCQYFDSVRQLSRIQSVSRHWRNILLAADQRYSHAYQTSGAVIRIKWTTEQENCTHSNASSAPDAWIQVGEQRPLGLAILEGLTICFRHIRIFSFNFECSSWTKKLIRRVVKLHKSLYTLLGSLHLLEHLSLSDHIRITEKEEETDSAGEIMSATISHATLADSIAHMTHLRTFYYDIGCVVRRESAWQLNQVQIPDALVISLTGSKQLRAIGGPALVQNMTQEQWILLLSSLDLIECLASMNARSMNGLKNICAVVDDNLHMRTAEAIIRIRALRQLEMVSYTESTDYVGGFFTNLWCRHEIMPLNFYQIAAEIGAHQIRSIHLHVTERYNPATHQYMYDGSDINIITSFPHLTSLTIDLKQRQDFYIFRNLTPDSYRSSSESSNKDITSRKISPLLHLRELTLYNINTRLNMLVMVPFLSSLAALRYISFYRCTLTSVDLLSLVTGCNRRLLELRIRKCLITGLLPSQIVEMIKVQSSLHLLTIKEVTLQAPSWKVKEPVFNCDRLAIESPKAAKMMQYAKVLTWIDLLTLDREQIQRRLKAAQTAETPKSSSLPLLETLRRYSGDSDWRNRWLLLQQVDQLEAKQTGQQKSTSEH